MKYFVTLIIILCSVSTVNAQKYLDHLKESNKGQGKVTVTQSKEIDDLVNGNSLTQKNQQTKPAANTAKTNAQTSTGEQKKTTVDNKNTPDKNKQDDKDSLQKKEEQEKNEEQARLEREEQARKEREEIARRERQRIELTDEEAENYVADTSKKVMRKSYKVNGYRVQAYLGGNSREDRAKAQEIGNAIKRKYPSEPVYVHFYSPRWTCRIGNYRTYEEASHMLKNIRKMGYKEATILRGKITVQY